MAYVSQDMKKRLAGNIKNICKKYGIKASLSVNHHSTLVLNIKSGRIDFIGNINETMTGPPKTYYELILLHFPLFSSRFISFRG